jgi:hypothetical protein
VGASVSLPVFYGKHSNYENKLYIAVKGTDYTAGTLSERD